MAMKAKAGTVEWLREKKAEQASRQAELTAAIEENRKKMESAAGKMSAALASGKKEEYYEAEKAFKDADFAIKHYELNPEVPLEVSAGEVSKIAAAVVKDHNQIMEAQAGRYKEALEALREALRGMAKQQNDFLTLCEEFGSLEGWATAKEKADLTNYDSGYDPAIVFLYKRNLIGQAEALDLEGVLNECRPLGPRLLYSILSNPMRFIDAGRYADQRGGLKVF